MKSIQLMGVGIILLALICAAGCTSQQSAIPKGGDKADKQSNKGAKDDDHSHGTGPHGGVVFDLGAGKYHAEFTVDHGKREASVYILGGDAKMAAPIKADTLLLSITEPKFQVELKAVPLDGEAKGLSSRFISKDEQLGKVQEFAGTVSGQVEGVPYAGDFKEEPEPPAKK